MLGEIPRQSSCTQASKGDIPWAWNLGQTSSEMQNCGISGPAERKIFPKPVICFIQSKDSITEKEATHGGRGSSFASNTHEIDDHEYGSHAQTYTRNTHQHEADPMRISVKRRRKTVISCQSEVSYVKSSFA